MSRAAQSGRGTTFSYGSGASVNTFSPSRFTTSRTTATGTHTRRVDPAGVGVLRHGARTTSAPCRQTGDAVTPSPAYLCLLGAPISKCLHRFSASWSLYLQSLHSRRSVIFLVVLACGARAGGWVRGGGDDVSVCARVRCANEAAPLLPVLVVIAQCQARTAPADTAPRLDDDGTTAPAAAHGGESAAAAAIAGRRMRGISPLPPPPLNAIELASSGSRRARPTAPSADGANRFAKRRRRQLQRHH